MLRIHIKVKTNMEMGVGRVAARGQLSSLSEMGWKVAASDAMPHKVTHEVN